VPRRLFDPFRSAIGSRAGLSSKLSAKGVCVDGCFTSPPCPRKTVTGHKCGLVLAELVGTSQLGYLWPAPLGPTFSAPSQNSRHQPFYDKWPANPTPNPKRPTAPVLRP